MTCIIGVIEKNRMFMGGDSAAVEGHISCPRKDEKVFTVGKMIFGGTGSYRATQVIRYHLKLPEHLPKQGNMSYLITKLIPSMRACFLRHGVSRINNSEEEISGTFLIAYNGKLYVTYGDFQVGEIYSSFYSVGSGSDFALGSLSSLPITISGRIRIRKSLCVAAEYCGGVKPPFVIKSIRF